MVDHTETIRYELKFKKEFVKPILSGLKTQTARTNKQKFRDGDYVWAISGGDAFAVLQIVSETHRKLSTFNYFDYLREGCLSEQEFIDVWEKIHPRKGFDPEQKVWVYNFCLSPQWKDMKEGSDMNGR